MLRRYCSNDGATQIQLSVPWSQTKTSALIDGPAGKREAEPRPAAAVDAVLRDRCWIVYMAMGGLFVLPRGRLRRARHLTAPGPVDRVERARNQNSAGPVKNSHTGSYTPPGIRDGSSSNGTHTASATSRGDAARAAPVGHQQPT